MGMVAGAFSLSKVLGGALCAARTRALHKVALAAVRPFRLLRDRNQFVCGAWV